MAKAALADINAVRYADLDAVGGMAGDMFVSAMLDALPALTSRVLSDVAEVLPPEAGDARLEPETRDGLTALRSGLAASTRSVAGCGLWRGCSSVLKA
jgi:uncharacterized protein (DUF111 family)